MPGLVALVGVVRAGVVGRRSAVPDRPAGRWWRIAVSRPRRRLRRVWRLRRIWRRELRIVHRRLRIYRWMWVLLPGLGLRGPRERWSVSAVFLTVVTALSCHGVQPSATPSWATVYAGGGQADGCWPRRGDNRAE